jgi:trk system potassium uptake protein TrkA
VLIDREPAVLEQAEEHLDVMTLSGDPTRRSVLLKAGVENADGFVALGGRDNDNVLAAALAKSIGAKTTVARMDAPDFYISEGSHELGLLGVDRIFCATRLATVKLADAVMSTHLPFLETFADATIRTALVSLGAGSEHIGKKAEEITFGKRVRTAAVVSNGYLRTADRVTSVEAGDQLLVVGAARDMLYLWRSSLPKNTRDRAFIIGGGDVGISLARLLGDHIHRVEVVEKNAAQAGKIAEQSLNATVFVGDARSATFLQDQQIDTVNWLLAATGDDEVNLLVSLLGRKLGVASPIVLLHRPGYAELYTELGIKGTVGLYDLVADHARYAISPYGMIRQESIPSTRFAVSEWRLPPHPAPLSKGGLRISDVPLPEDVRIIGVSTGTNALRFTGETQLKGGETLILLSPEESIAPTRRRLKNLLQEKAP